MIPARAELIALSRTLLDSTAVSMSRLEAAQGLHERLLQLAGDRLPESEMDREIQLSHGVAISPRDAARCVLDFARTSGFLRGVERAIRETRSRYPDRPVEMLYAGCGPLAPLAVPMAARYGPEELRITLLEIHPGALASARRIFEALGLTDSVREFVEVDAVEYRAPAERRWDVCVVEAIQQALEKEPQLAITAQLAPQLAEHGILVPERITISAFLDELASEFRFPVPDKENSGAPMPVTERQRVELGPLLVLERGSVAALMETAESGPEPGERVLREQVVEIPPAAMDSHTLILRTTIHIAEGIDLEDHDSGLTVPRALHSLGRVRSGDRLGFRYRLGPRPGFVARRVGSR